MADDTTTQQAPLSKTLDDPAFRKLSPAAQKIVLGKRGVSADMQDKLLAKISGNGAATGTGTAGQPSGSAAPPSAQPDWLTRTSNRIGQNLRMLGHPMEAARGISDIVSKEKHPGTTLLERGRDYLHSIEQDWEKDSANVVGDIAGGWIMGEIMGPESRAKGKSAGKLSSLSPSADAVPPSEDFPLTVEQQQAYKEKLMKASRDHHDALVKFHEARTALFDEAKRQQIKQQQKAEVGQQQFKSDVDAARRKAQAAEEQQDRERLNKLTAEFDKAKRAQMEAEQAHTEATQKIEADNAQALAEHAKKLGEIERGKKLAGWRDRYAQVVKDNVRMVHERVRSQLEDSWNALREQAKGQTLNSKNIMDAITDARKLLVHPEDLKVFNEIVKRMTAETEDETAGGDVKGSKKKGAKVAKGKDAGAGTEPILKPTTWEEGRAHYTELGQRWADADGAVRKSLGQVKEAVGRELDAAAGRVGQAFQRRYATLKARWAEYLTDWKDAGGTRTGGSPLRDLNKMEDLPTIAKHVGGDVSARLRSLFGKYKRYGANVSALKGLEEMQKAYRAAPKKPPEAPPKLTPPPSVNPKGPYATRGMNIPEGSVPGEKGVAPGDYTPISDAKAATGEPNPIPEASKYPQNAPEPANVPKPKGKAPAPVKAGKFARMGARVAGGIAGGAAGAVVGHPWPGIILGREAGGDIIENWLNKRAARRGKVPSNKMAVPQHLQGPGGMPSRPLTDADYMEHADRIVDKVGK